MDIEQNSQAFMNFNNPEKKLVIEDFATKIVLGKGSFAKVILVKKKDNGRFYAMKILKKSKLDNQRQVDNVIIERNILVGVNHPFVIKLCYSFQNNEKLYFVLEYCPGGELFNLLHKQERFNEDHLKPENVMIDFEGYIRLTDFGLSKNNVSNQDKAFSVCGTPEYLAPEILTMKGHEKTVDWWSLGALIYELLTGLPPFYNQNRDVMYDSIMNFDVFIPEFMTPPCKDLIFRFLQKNPEQRLGRNGSQEIKSHPWFFNVDWEILYRKEYRPPFIPVINQDMGLSHFQDEFKNLPIESWSNSAKDVPHKTIEGFTYNQSQNKYMDIQQ